MATQKGDKLYSCCERKARASNASFTLDKHDCIHFHGLVWLPNDEALEEQILVDLQKSKFSLHVSGTMMCHNAKRTLWWSSAKINIAKFFLMFDLPIGQGKTSEAERAFAALKDTRMEME